MADRVGRSLREELIDELHPFIDGDFNDPEQRAAEAFDAILDRLYRERLAWFIAANPLAKTEERYELLYAGIDALRNSDDSR